MGKLMTLAVLLMAITDTTPLQFAGLIGDRVNTSLNQTGPALLQMTTSAKSQISGLNKKAAEVPDINGQLSNFISSVLDSVPVSGGTKNKIGTLQVAAEELPPVKSQKSLNLQQNIKKSTNRGF